MAVPLIYRVVFFIFDFLLPLGGVVGHVLFPETIIAGWTPTPHSPPTVETRVLLDMMAGFFAGLALMHVFLQLYPKDNKIWNIIITNLILVDLFTLLGFTRAMNAEGRLTDTGKWLGQDWGNIVGYSVITLIRILFVFTSGSTREAKGKKRL